MTSETKEKLIFLAEKYETPLFCENDPSQYLRWYDCSDKSNLADVECAAFISAMLAFGSRKQFLPKIQFILELADSKGGISFWLKKRFFENDFNSPDGNNEKKFYRFYSYNEMKVFFGEFSNILEKYESLGKAIKISKNPVASIQSLFSESKIVSKGKDCANKRIYMFLRWMVRKNSPVDLGVWDFINPSDLVIPLDTHVLQESVNLCLINENASANLRTALKITEALKEVWPEDPCKGDFALFGSGVSNE